MNIARAHVEDLRPADVADITPADVVEYVQWASRPDRDEDTSADCRAVATTYPGDGTGRGAVHRVLLLPGVGR
jgi:hypothetical protein